MIEINLLPEAIRENIAYSKNNRKVLGYVKILIIIGILVTASFGVLYTALAINNVFFLKSIRQSDIAISKYQDALEEAKGLEARIASIGKIKKDYKYWSKFNYAIEKSTPTGVYLSGVKLEDQNAAVTDKSGPKDMKILVKVSGYAATKNDVGLLRDSLAKKEGFKTVNVESVKEEDDPTDGKRKNGFNISFVIMKEAVQKGDK